MSSIILQNSLGTQRPDLADAIYQYQPDGVSFVADQIAPRLDVTESAGRIEVVTRKSMLQLIADERQPSGEYPSLDAYLDKVDYTTTDRGMVYTLKDGDRTTVQLNRELMAMNMLKSAILRAREKRVLDAIFNTATWTGSALLTTPSTPWTTKATATPIDDVIAAKKKVRDVTGVTPNTLILSALNLERLLVCTQIRNQFVNTTIPTAEAIKNSLAQLFGLEKLIICESVYDSAPEGKAASVASQCTDLYVQVARIGNENDPVAPSVMFTPTFIEDGGLPYVVESNVDFDVRGIKYRIRNHVGELVVDAYFSHMLKVAS